MINVVGPPGGAFLGLCRMQRRLLLENLACRQQLAAFKRRHPRPKLPSFDNLFWVLARTFWSGWKQLLIVVSPEIVERPTRIKQHDTISGRWIASPEPKPDHASQSAASVVNASLQACTDHASQALIRARILWDRCRIAFWRTIGLKELPHRWRSGGSPGKCLDAQAFQRQANKALMLIEGSGLIAHAGKRWTDDDCWDAPSAVRVIAL